MPSEIYGTLYNQNDLNMVITMVKDIYAKKPEPASLLTATAAAAPFTLMKASDGSRKQTHFHDGEFLSERIDRLTKTLYRTDMEGKHTKKPYKPYITRRRGGRNGFRSRGCHSGSNRREGWPRSKKKIQRRKRRISHRGRSQGRKLDKSPTTRRPEYPAKLKTKTDVTIAISEDTLQLNVPR